MNKVRVIVHNKIFSSLEEAVERNAVFVRELTAEGPLLPVVVEHMLSMEAMREYCADPDSLGANYYLVYGRLAKVVNCLGDSKYALSLTTEEIPQKLLDVIYD